jgi:cyclase
MLKRRIIPILTFNGFALVKTKQFTQPRMVGNPVQAARVYNSRGVDELVFLDIMATTQNRKFNEKLTADVIKECFMPVAIGGGIRDVDDMKRLFRLGADKVVLRNAAFEQPDLVREAVYQFGSQAITVALDVQQVAADYEVRKNAAGECTALAPFVQEMEALGVGEYILTSIAADGMQAGFDLPLVQRFEQYTRKPFVVCGGAGHPDHFTELFSNTAAEAAGAASLYNFTRYTPQDVKKALNQHQIPVRL